MTGWPAMWSPAFREVTDASLIEAAGEWRDRHRRFPPRIAVGTHVTMCPRTAEYPVRGVHRLLPWNVTEVRHRPDQWEAA
jgi:hypothetical protein